MPDDNAAGTPPSTGNGDRSDVRIGVFICHCGGNISDLVDVKWVAAQMRKLPGVVYSDTQMFMCSDPSQALIEEKIKELKLNRVVVAACSPTLHVLTFRRALARAGLNQFLFEHVNIREQCSWVVEDRAAATAKAERLIRAAVSRIRHLVPLEMRRIPVHDTALVIGGGIAGLVSTRDLAQRGMKVLLVERTPFLGGRMAQLGKVFPTNDDSRELLNKLITEVTGNPLVSIYTAAEIIATQGVVGDFRVKLRLTPRGVTAPLANLANVIATCPEETSDEFNFGLNKRKALYIPYAQSYPALPAIDWQSCTKCGKCITAAGGKGISLDSEPKEIDLRAGVIVIATGSDPYEPLSGEFGYKTFPQVVTLQQLTRMLDPSGPTAGKLPVNGKPIRSIGIMHCVGARQLPGVAMSQPDGKLKDYCARTCCSGALHTALQIRERFPDIHIYDIHQDVRSYGRGHEDLYDRAAQNGVIFLRHRGSQPPTVDKDARGQSNLVVKVIDELTLDNEIEVPVDLLVLATGVVPHNISELIDLYKCAVGADGFLLEVHPKLRPVELAVSGVFLSGTCQYAMDITESSAAAAAAASKAAGMIAQQIIELDPFIAQVDEELCTGCSSCLNACPFDAITRDEEKKVAVVNPALCTGCGTCAALCPSGAIQQFGFSDTQVLAELTALLDKVPAEVAG